MPSPERRRREAAPALERAVAKPKSQVREYAEALAVALLLALVIRTFVVQAFKIPSGSMLPTLQIGDHLLVNKFLYGARLEIPLTDVSLGRLPGLRKPRPGDVIVFLAPAPASPLRYLARTRTARRSPACGDQAGDGLSSLHLPRRDEGARRVGPPCAGCGRSASPRPSTAAARGEPAVRNGAARERGRRRSAYEAPNGSVAPGPRVQRRRIEAETVPPLPCTAVSGHAPKRSPPRPAR